MPFKLADSGGKTCGDNCFMNQLDALKRYTTVVADTGDFQQISRFHPQDATTNPSLILKAVQMPSYHSLLQTTLQAHPGAPLDEHMDRLLVQFGCNILALIPVVIALYIWILRRRRRRSSRRSAPSAGPRDRHSGCTAAGSRTRPG